MTKKNRQSSIVNRQSGGFTLLEATMGMVLLAIAAAGVVMPFSAAAASQADAQRRVVATRFAADLVEMLIAGESLSQTVTAADLGYSGSAYNGLAGQIQVNDSIGIDGLTLVTVSVSHHGRPMISLKTLAGNE